MLDATAPVAPSCLVLVAWIVVGAFAASAPAHADSRPGADLVVTHARVWTNDPARPQAEAFAVIGERIVAVGSNDEIAAWRGPATRALEAGGRRVLPGFDDAHVHLVDGSQRLTQVKLKDADSPAEFARRIAAQAQALPAGEWILGGDWDDQAFAAPRLPTRQDVDALTAAHPVFVHRYDGHMALANSAALRAAGVSASTPDPAGGLIVRDARGEPTGVLKDAAMGLVQAKVPPLGREGRLRALREGLRYAASKGVTSVQDMGSSAEDVAAYAELLERGELTLRIHAVASQLRWEQLAQVGLGRAFGSPWLRLGAVKGFADGSLGSTTALFFEPYADDRSTRVLFADEFQSLDAAGERLQKADAAGLQLCTHAIGDRAIATVLDLYEALIAQNGPRDRRLRIEHAQHIAAADFARFARLPVIASVQPYHAVDDGRWADARIGAERARTTYAFRSLLDAGARLAIGTDWFVADLDPMQTLQAAVTRATLDGRHPQGWIPEQKITVAEAIAAYTEGSAYAEFQEHEKGRLAPGRLADFVVLSEDVFAIPAHRIGSVKVETTVVGGRVVYERAPNGGPTGH